MTVFAQTLINPGAESGSTVGWTSYGDVLHAQTSSSGVTPHSGSYLFGHNDGFAENTGQYQDIVVDPSLEASIDAGLAALHGSGWYNNDGFDLSSLEIRCYDSGMTLLEQRDTSLAPSVPGNTWEFVEIYMMFPVGTRTVRFGTKNHTGGFASRCRWDDFLLDFSDAGEVDWPTELAFHVQQYAVHVLGIYPTSAIEANQYAVNLTAASEGSSGLYDVKAHQYGVHVLVRPHGDRRQLRAFTFKQDDHEFYGVNLGTALTLIADKTTGTWSQWRSPGYNYWRVEDVTDWEGMNIACDPLSGKLWQIDPEGRLDEDTTPITSIVYGGFTKRFRVNAPCYMAEAALSEGQPPPGIDASTIGIQLRTSDDGGLSYLDHGVIPGEALGDAITVRWYGLGLMDKPGMIFELTDTGYARRLDGLDIEVGGDDGPV